MSHGYLLGSAEDLGCASSHYTLHPRNNVCGWG